MSVWRNGIEEEERKKREKTKRNEEAFGDLVGFWVSLFLFFAAIFLEALPAVSLCSRFFVGAVLVGDPDRVIQRRKLSEVLGCWCNGRVVARYPFFSSFGTRRRSSQRQLL